jgi:drug/metabolite transporter (DMT)-like permease
VLLNLQNDLLQLFLVMSENSKGYRTQDALPGIIFMIINTLALSLVDINSKLLKSFGMQSTHIVFYYKTLLFLCILPWVLSKGIPKTKKIRVHFFRSILSVLASICFVSGLKYISIADASALENTKALLVVMAGVLFFGDKLTKTKTVALLTGCLGAFIVANPSFLSNPNSTEQLQTNPTGYIFIIMAVVLWSLNSITIKILGKTESHRGQTFYLMLFASVFSAIFALVKWKSVGKIGQLDLTILPAGINNLDDMWLNPDYIKYLAMMALCYFIHNLSYFQSLKSDMSVVIPFRYTKLVFSGILGFLMFDEVPYEQSYFGYLLIIVSGLLLLRYEIRRAKRKVDANKEEENNSN